MKIKRFVANDMRHALAEVTRAYGVDAVVLSSRRLAEGGVEVLAAEASAMPAEEGASPKQGGATPTKGGATPTKAGAIPANAENNSAPGSFEAVLRDQQMDNRGEQLRKQLDALRAHEKAGEEDPVKRHSSTAAAAGRQNTAAEQSPAMQQAFSKTSEEVGHMRSELNSIRNLLDQRLGAMAWEQFSSRTPVQATVWERLNAMGIPGYMSKRLIERLKPEYSVNQAWRFTMAWLTSAMSMGPEDPVARGGIFAFLGPTGVGKTTTIGKLATRYVLENGPESVALVTTDSYRIAAHEQLRTLGRILGVTVRIVDHRHTLSDTLASLSHKMLVLIDTAGLHPQDEALQEQIADLQQHSEIEKLLVLACTSQGRVLNTAYRAYARVGLDGCVLSKLDEAGSLGEVLSLVIDRSLPLVYETHGQSIPDDIRPAHGKRLISEAVRLARAVDEEGQDQERMRNEFASVWPGTAAGNLAVQMN